MQHIFTEQNLSTTKTVIKNKAIFRFGQYAVRDRYGCCGVGGKDINKA